MCFLAVCAPPLPSSNLTLYIKPGLLYLLYLHCTCCTSYCCVDIDSLHENSPKRYEQLFMSLRQKDPPTFTRLTGSLRAKSNNALSDKDAASLSDALRRKDASSITFSSSTEMMASLMKKDPASIQNRWSASLYILL